MDVYKLVRRFKRKYSMTIAFNIKKHSNVVNNVIDRDETVLYAFCGQKNDVLTMIFDTCVVAVTNKRIIVGQKRILWGYRITVVTPELFNDLKLDSGILFGRVEIDTAKEVIHVSDIDKNALDEIETNVNNIMIENKKRFRMQ